MVWWFKMRQFSIQSEMSERIKNQSASFETIDITQQGYFNKVKDDGKENSD